jgi:hypothetical protein
MSGVFTEAQPPSWVTGTIGRFAPTGSVANALLRWK